MQIEIKVTLRADEALLSALRALGGGQKWSVPVQQVPPAEVPAEIKREETAAPAAEVPVEIKREETAAPAAEPENPEPAPARPSMEDVRAAMEAARKRCEYPGGAEERDERLHRRMTAIFKEEARRLGAERPSELAPEARAAFIEAVRSYELNSDGAPEPFPF